MCLLAAASTPARSCVGRRRRAANTLRACMPQLAVKRTHFPLQASQHPNPLVRTPFRPAAIIPPAPRPRLMQLPVPKKPPAAAAEDQPIYKIPSAEEIFCNLAPMKTSHLYEVAWSDFVAFLNSPHYSTSVSNKCQPPGKGKCFIYSIACLPNG